MIKGRFSQHRTAILFAGMAGLLLMVGFLQSWNLSLAIVNLCLISAIMALGINIQWGYAGLLNVGVMGFVALGGLAAVLVSAPPVQEAWEAGGSGIIVSAIALTLTITAMWFVHGRTSGRNRLLIKTAIGVAGYFITRAFFTPAVEAIEVINPATSGYLGGLGLPILLSWIVGGIFAAGAAFVVGKVALGLRSDYLAIATLGISEIIIAILKFEDWMTRGVKNVIGLPRPVPYEVNIQKSPFFQELAADFNIPLIEFSSIIVKLCYASLFGIVLLFLLYLAEKALNSPWGRMMRAIRDNETAAEAMGKNVTGRHLQVFVLGSAIIGVAGAMLTTLDGQFTPASYQPLRFTFLIWVMVIVGGSGNNFGAVLGGFLIWFAWVEAEPVGLMLMEFITSGMAEDYWLRDHLLNSAAHMRLMTMGLILLLVLRFAPQGLIPERRR